MIFTAFNTGCRGDYMSSSNNLINESSPYLQQHARNPVNWYPWGMRLSKGPGMRKNLSLSVSVTLPVTGAM